jgi:hypothetical protein
MCWTVIFSFSLDCTWNYSFFLFSDSSSLVFYDFLIDLKRYLVGDNVLITVFCFKDLPIDFLLWFAWRMERGIYRFPSVGSSFLAVTVWVFGCSIYCSGLFAEVFRGKVSSLQAESWIVTLLLIFLCLYSAYSELEACMRKGTSTSFFSSNFFLFWAS